MSKEKLTSKIQVLVMELDEAKEILNDAGYLVEDTETNDEEVT